MEPIWEPNEMEWISLSHRLFKKVEELEILMEEVRSDLDRYRTIRNEWMVWHTRWKEMQSKRAANG
ncbi:hypothetical protein P3G55_11810 [Leptospira sp. 96542]|nr:hypothetical protein [Leptospira sp. 96542]